MQHSSLFVFDIETVPDTDVAPRLVGETGSTQARRAALAQYHLDLTEGKNSFLRQPFHKVVAISFLEAELRGGPGSEQVLFKSLRSGGKIESDEKELLSGFFHYVGKLKPRLVSFNGRTFDLPVLRYRAMLHGISAPWFYLSGDKWNSYTQRYSLDWHCDLLEAFSDFGASARVKLNEICALLGFPGKIGVDGSDVAGLYDEGKIQEIRDYCECDVLNTYLVYLRYKQHRGEMSIENYERAIRDVQEFLDQEKEERKHLGEFLNEWQH